MEQKSKEDVLGKIKKLMALGMKHEDTPEGKSALKKAEDLMAKHDIRFLDVEDDGTIQDENMIKSTVPWNRQRNDFEQYLVGHIARTLDCEYVITAKGTKNAGHILIGTKTDVELVEWLFKFTRLQCYQLASKQPYKGKELRTYFFGMMFVIKDKVTDTFGKVKSEVKTEDQCNALIVVKKDAVERKKKELFPRLKKGRKMRPLSGGTDAYFTGAADGEKVSVQRNITN